MDLDAKAIRVVQFREKMRGYNPDEVDAFLEQVADGIDVLYGRINDLTERLRLSRSESKASESPGSNESSATPDFATTTELYEIFSLAKKSADDIKQAARRDADQMLLDVQTEAEAMREEAYREVGELRENELQMLKNEISDLERKRDAAREELKRLGSVATNARNTVKISLSEALMAVESSFSGLYDPEANKAVDGDSVNNPQDGSTNPSNGLSNVNLL